MGRRRGLVGILPILIAAFHAGIVTSIPSCSVRFKSTAPLPNFVVEDMGSNTFHVVQVTNETHTDPHNTTEDHELEEEDEEEGELQLLD